MRGEFAASPTLSELILSALTGAVLHRCLCLIPRTHLPLPFVTSAALIGNMKANYLVFTKWLCALWSMGTCYHLHHREPGHRHHAVNLGGPDEVIDFLATMLKKQNSQLTELAQVNTTTSQAPPPQAPNPPAEDGSSSRSKVPGYPNTTKRPANDALLLGVVVACAVAGLVALSVAGVCWCRMRKEMKMAERTDYPAYKQSPPPPYEKSSPGDKKLAQNAQMYHYQHQKQQMISMEKNKDELKHPDSAVTSDEENEDGDFTVYECPGLAPTGEMEVKNPLFDDSSLHHPSHGHH